MQADGIETLMYVHQRRRGTSDFEGQIGYFSNTMSVLANRCGSLDLDLLEGPFQIVNHAPNYI